MLITRETDYALRMLRVLLDEEKHSAAEMAETELIPMQFAYQILRKRSRRLPAVLRPAWRFPLRPHGRHGRA